MLVKGSRFCAHFIGRMLVAALALLAASAPVLAIDLAIEITPDEPYASDVLKVRVMVGNAGTAPVHDLRLELTYPTGLQTTSFANISDGGVCTGTSCVSGNTLSWDLGTLAAGATRTMHLPPTVASGVSEDTVIQFSLEAFSGATFLNNTSQSVRVRNTPRLAVFIDPAADPLPHGQAQHYAISFANQTTQASTNSELRVSLPADTTLVYASDGGVQVGDEVIWNLEIVQAGQADRRHFSLLPGATWESGELMTIETVQFSGTIDNQAADAIARTATRIESAPDLSFHLSFGPDPARPGTLMVGRLTVANQGLDTASGVTVELPYPRFLNTTSFASISDDGSCSGTSCVTGNIVRWELGNLQPGEGRSVFLPPTTVSSIPNGRPLLVQARTRADNRAAVWHRQTLIFGQDRPLTLEVEADRKPARPGEPLRFELSYGNAGSAAATDTALVFPVPAGTTVIDFSAGGSVQGDALVWETGLLQAGQTGRHWVRVEVDPVLADGELIRIDQARFSGQLDFISRTAWGRTQVRVEQEPALEVALNPGMLPIRPGSVVPIEVSVTNRSGETLDGLRLEMPYPAAFGTTSFANITDDGVCSGTSCLGGNVLAWDLGSLPAGQGRSVAFQGVVGSGLASGRLPTLNVRAIAQGQGDAWSRRTLLTDSQTRLSVAVVAGQDPVASGNDVEYRLSFGNPSQVATTDAQLMLQLPGGAQVLMADGGVLQGDMLVWDLDELAPGQVGRRTVRIGFDPPPPNGTLLRLPMVRLAGLQDFVERQTWASRDVRIGEMPQLGLEMDLAPDPARPGDLAVPRLTVTNRSAVLQTGLQVEMLYPSGFGSLANSGLSDGGFCPGTTCNPGQLVTWNLGSLPPGGGRTIFVPASLVPAMSAGVHVPLSARTTADGLRDRWRRESLVVAGPNTFALALDLEDGPHAPGSNVMLRLHYGNRSNQPIENTRLRFELPPGLSLVTISDGAIQNGRWIEWPVGTLEPGQVSRRSALLRVDSAAQPAELLKLVRARISGDTNLLNPEAWADGTLRVAAQRNLSVSLAMNPQVAGPGEQLDIDLVVTNHASVPATGVRVDMPYPQHLSSLGNSAITGGACQGTACNRGNTVTWTPGTLQPGEARVLSLTPTVVSGTSAPALGSLIRFYARVRNEQLDQGVAAISVLVGEWVEPPPMVDTLFADRFELAVVNP